MMKNKVRRAAGLGRMLLVGDSIMGNLYESLLCSIYTGGHEAESLSEHYRPSFLSPILLSLPSLPDHSLFPFFPPDPSALPRNPSDPQRGHKPLNSVKAIFFPTFNFSVAYYFSPYLMDAFQQQANGAKRGGAHGYVVNVTSVHPVVVRLLPMYDVAVFSSGTWWLQNVPGRKQPNTFMVNGVVQQNITNIEAFKTGLKTLANHVKQSNFSGIPFFLTFNPKHGPVMRTARGDGACGAVQPIGPKGAFKWYESIRTAEEYFKMQRRVLTSSSNMRVVKEFRRKKTGTAVRSVRNHRLTIRATPLAWGWARRYTAATGRTIANQTAPPAPPPLETSVQLFGPSFRHSVARSWNTAVDSSLGALAAALRPMAPAPPTNAQPYPNQLPNQMYAGPYQAANGGSAAGFTGPGGISAQYPAGQPPGMGAQWNSAGGAGGAGAYGSPAGAATTAGWSSAPPPMSPSHRLKPPLPLFNAPLLPTPKTPPFLKTPLIPRTLRLPLRPWRPLLPRSPEVPLILPPPLPRQAPLVGQDGGEGGMGAGQAAGEGEGGGGMGKEEEGEEAERGAGAGKEVGVAVEVGRGGGLEREEVGGERAGGEGKGGGVAGGGGGGRAGGMGRVEGDLGATE
ncbi:unnamed protein product [Closterium sp. Naga37s-1]|nr:unnamed protein product [Closterium sp. Naga37s-1]